MADSLTTVLYIIVLAGWFCMMCFVLRCCRETDVDSIFDLEEISISAMYHKPTTIVDAQPVRFARVQPLGDSSLGLPGGGATATTAAGAGSSSTGSRSTNRSHLQEEMALDRLEMPTTTDPALALPSAQEVWSPILALRTFVEPLTSRASAAFRNFQISFHDPEDQAGGGGGGGGGSSGGGVGIATTAVAVVAAADEQRRRDGQREEQQSTAAAAAAATEELRQASAEPYWPPGSGGIEMAVVSRSGHDRAEEGGGGGAAAGGEEKRIDAAEMKDDDDGYGNRIAV